MNFREITHDDKMNFVKAYMRAYKELADYKYWTEVDIKGYFKWLYKRDKYGFFCVENEKAELIGCVASDSNWINYECENVLAIHELFVIPEYRKMGIGTRLLAEASKYGARKGRKKAELWVGRTNYEAITFYKKFGFTEVDILGKWVRMVKLLNPDPQEILNDAEKFTMPNSGF